MAYQQPTKGFLTYLRQQPAVRRQIRAAPNRTLLYAGAFMKPMWKEIEQQKRQNVQLQQKEILPEVLARVLAPGSGHANLLAYVQDVERQVPWQPDGFTVWRALSGIFASNAVGAVSFQIGSGVTAGQKVFAATEVGVLLRNPHVDGTTRDLLAYFDRCIRSRDADINIGFVAG